VIARVLPHENAMEFDISRFRAPPNSGMPFLTARTSPRALTGLQFSLEDAARFHACHERLDAPIIGSKIGKRPMVEVLPLDGISTAILRAAVA
jgi:hypothetical protein